MYTRKRYKKIYRNGKYGNYLIQYFKSELKKYTIDLIKSTYLCIRFPFLYPRNRFSDKHYTNWKLSTKKQKIFNKWLTYSETHIDEYKSKFLDCTFLNDTCVKANFILKLATFNDRFLYKFYDILENVIGYFHCLPTYTELDGMSDGWRKRFGIQFCKELKEAIKKCPNKNYMKEFRIMDIKEKWGKLVIYTSGTTNEVNRVIQKYEYISQFVCITCGEDAIKKSLGWISPYCEKHLPNNQKWIWINPVYGWSNFEHEKYNDKVKGEMF